MVGGRDCGESLLTLSVGVEWEVWKGRGCIGKTELVERRGQDIEGFIPVERGG